MSALERGIYSPTAEKLDAISSVLRVHPVTILAETYLRANRDIDAEELLRMVQEELAEIDKVCPYPEEKA